MNFKRQNWNYRHPNFMHYDVKKGTFVRTPVVGSFWVWQNCSEILLSHILEFFLQWNENFFNQRLISICCSFWLCHFRLCFQKQTVTSLVTETLKVRPTNFRKILLYFSLERKWWLIYVACDTTTQRNNSI